MNISKKFWFRLQDNIGYIIFLSILQILVAIKFPGYSFLGATANAIMKPILGIVGIMCIIFLFSVSDRVEKLFVFNFSPEFDGPLRTFTRIFSIMVFLLSFIASIYFMSKFFNYSKSYYMLLYIYTVFLCYFLYLTIQKGKN